LEYCEHHLPPTVDTTDINQWDQEFFDRNWNNNNILSIIMAADYLQVEGLLYVLSYCTENPSLFFAHSKDGCRYAAKKIQGEHPDRIQGPERIRELLGIEGRNNQPRTNQPRTNQPRTNLRFGVLSVKPWRWLVKRS
jgi:hypothetical protein